jgi:putative transposase
MIASTNEGYNFSDILRDFKKQSSKRIMAEIEANPQESRKNWMVWIFQSAGKKNSNNKNHQFWQQDNHTIELSTNAMIDQRLQYIHMNSVKKRIIDEPEHYVYSSAKDYSGGKGLMMLVFCIEAVLNCSL